MQSISGDVPALPPAPAVRPQGNSKQEAAPPAAPRRDRVEFGASLQIDADGNQYELDQYANEFHESIKTGNLVRHYREKGGRHITEIMTSKGKVRLVMTYRIGYHAGRDLARLARLHGIADARKFVSGVRGQMYRVRGNRYADKEEVQAALRDLEFVARRAGAKLGALKKEELLQIQSRRAAQNQELERSLALRREWKRRRTVRRIREYGQILTVRPGDFPDQSQLDAPEPVTEAAPSGSAAGGGLELLL